MTTLADARDAMQKLLKDAVDAYNAANGKTVPVLWEDTNSQDADGARGRDVSNLRMFVRHNLGDQDTLGGAGHRRFTRAGIVMVQVLTTPGDGFTTSDALVTVARNAFEGVSTPNGVWFRRVAVKELGKVGSFNQVNVTASFEYTETR